MQVKVLSDIHLEFFDQPIYELEGIFDRVGTLSDVLVLAGDICTIKHPFYKEVMEFLCYFAKYVVYVPGNHEYYGSSISEGRKIIDNLKIDNLFPLFPGSGVVILEGHKFVGCTMWFPPGYNPNKEIYLNDFRHIKNLREDLKTINKETIQHLEDNVSSDSIVVTHHMPSYNSIGHKYVTSDMNCFYVRNMEYLIHDYEPKMWLHGHSHDPVSYTLGRTRILSNPIDYPIYWNKNTFNRFEQVIDI